MDNFDLNVSSSLEERALLNKMFLIILVLKLPPLLH
jgi:hypothetical protein